MVPHSAGWSDGEAPASVLLALRISKQKQLIQGLVVGGLEEGLHFVGHVKIHVHALGGDGLLEPAGVGLFSFAVQLQFGNGIVSQFFESGIAFAQHAAVSFKALRSSYDNPFGGFFGFGPLAGQKGVVNEKGYGAAGFHGTEGVAVVLGADDADAEFFLVIHFVQQHFRGGSGGNGNIFALEVVKVLDARILVGQQAGTHNEEGVGKIDLLLAVGIVGGRATFEIVGAVLEKGNAVLRCNGYKAASTILLE